MLFYYRCGVVARGCFYDAMLGALHVRPYNAASPLRVTTMRDLYRFLSEHPPLVLQAIAQAWQVEFSLGDSRGTIARLVSAMQQPEGLVDVLATTTPSACAALGSLVRQRGIIPVPRLRRCMVSCANWARPASNVRPHGSIRNRPWRSCITEA